MSCLLHLLNISYRRCATLSAHRLADTAAPADPPLPEWRAHSRCFMSFKTKTITSTRMLSLYRPQGEPPEWGIFSLISLSSAKHSTSAFRWPLQRAVVTMSNVVGERWVAVGARCSARDGRVVRGPTQMGCEGEGIQYRGFDLQVRGRLPAGFELPISILALAGGDQHIC